MAEAVAGLSLAANILQMVEYGAVFAKTAWKIHSEQADPDVVKEFKELQYLAKDVEKVLECLEQDISAASQGPGGDPQLAGLAEECRQVTVEILEFVGKTGNQKSWKARMHKAVKEAFQLTWGQGKLAKLQTRLDRMRSQLTLRLVYSIRNFAAASTQRQELVLQRILEEIKQHTGTLYYPVDKAPEVGLGTAAVDLIAMKQERLAGTPRSTVLGESLRFDILRMMSEPGRAPEGSDSTMFKTFDISPQRKETLKEKLLEDLSYPDMLFREESVVRASETTFRWILEREQQPDRPWASFCAWLEDSDKQLYWITGKPGSGKSTLMKFISQPPPEEPVLKSESSPNEPRCLPFLKSWAGSYPLIVASYYFWALGSPMQRSKEGMLRTLLHSLLSQATPEAIATIMPERWEALHLFDEDPQFYTQDPLQVLLSRTFDYMCPSTRICVFIDGLDEFEGEHEDLILYLRDALRTYPIKLCVSSRQWQVFEDAFHDTPSLRLQDLTLPDMLEYVQSELYAGPAFAQLRERDPYFSDRLSENVALRSDGVFLWVTLVVKSLRKGITAGDRISDLQIRLDQLPQDLEPLFERILDDLDPEYLDHAIQYFRLMEACREIGLPNVMVFSYADEEDETFGIKCSISPLDWKTYESRRDRLRRRLNSRCMGLLETTEPKRWPLHVAGEAAFNHASESRVNYLHRTVGDYISRDEVRERLNRRAGRGFDSGDDSHLRLCSSELAFYKSSPLALEKTHSDGPRSPFEELTLPGTRCLHHAGQVQKCEVQAMLRLVEVLESFYPVNSKRYYDSIFVPAGVVYEGGRWGSLVLRGITGPPLVREAVEHGVVEYIRTKAYRQKPVLAPKFWRETSSARRAHRWLSGHKTDMWSEIDWQLAVAVVAKSPSRAVIELLLEMGASPRYIHDGEKVSVWGIVLMVYMHAWQRKLQGGERWEQIVALMIKHGAPVETRIIKQAYEELARRLHMGEKDDPFCLTIEKQLKIMKQGLR